jgi:outer membrane lipoprotein-sorting protein
LKRIIPILLILVLLAGCAGARDTMDRAMALRSALLAKGAEFDATVTADYGDKTYSFGMHCRMEAQGKVTFSVTAPETIAGITGIIDDDGGALTFDDKALHFDLLTDDQLSPVSAPWILVKTLRSGYLTSPCKEEEGLRLTIDDSYDDDALTVDIWLDPQDLPYRSEILYDGRRILTLDVRNVVMA